jgi:sugar/nucleoside kinase (ribokinase family)
MHALLEYTDIFLPSHEELLTIMATKDLDAAIAKVHQKGPSLVCVKRGAQGSLISEKRSKGEFYQFSQKAFDIEIVDTTGAGDGFDAGLIVGLVRGLSLEDAVKQGTAMASLVITKLGAMTALPSETELESFLKRYKVS